MLQRKNNLNKKSHCLVFGFFLFFLGFYFFSQGYMTNKRQEIFDSMNLKLYHKEENVKSTEVEVPEITSVEKESEPEVEKKVETNEVESKTPVTVENKSNTLGYIGTIEIPKIGLEAGFVSMDSKDNQVNKNVSIMPTSTYPDVEFGNFILAAHSGVGKIAYFNNLYQLKLDDTVTITYQGTQYQYKIVNIYKEPKNGKVAIHRDFNKTTLTLITCTNHDNKTQTIYIAERI